MNLQTHIRDEETEGGLMYMKKLLKRAGMVFLLVLLAIPCIPVAAEETALVMIKANEVKAGDTSVTVRCDIEGGALVSSGKIRILYDAEKMQLKSAQAGNALTGAMCEINDCLKGNKDEGELVAAFASASRLSGDGSLLNMVFSLDSSVKEGTILEVTADVEELAGDDTDVPANTVNFSAKVEKKESDEQQDTSNEEEEIPDSTGKLSTKKKQTAVDISQKNGRTSKTGSVKTKDDTDILLPAALAGAALLSIVVVGVKKKGRMK